MLLLTVLDAYQCLTPTYRMHPLPWPAQIESWYHPLPLAWVDKVLPVPGWKVSKGTMHMHGTSLYLMMLLC